MSAAEKVVTLVRERAQTSQNADGSVIVHLRKPVTWEGERLERVTIPALRGRQLRTMPTLTEETPFGEIIAWAANVVEPVGIVDELYPTDAIDVARTLSEQLGKDQ